MWIETEGNKDREEERGFEKLNVRAEAPWRHTKNGLSSTWMPAPLYYPSVFMMLRLIIFVGLFCVPPTYLKKTLCWLCTREPCPCLMWNSPEIRLCRHWIGSDYLPNRKDLYSRCGWQGCLTKIPTLTSAHHSSMSFVLCSSGNGSIRVSICTLKFQDSQISFKAYCTRFIDIWQV